MPFARRSTRPSLPRHTRRLSPALPLLVSGMMLSPGACAQTAPEPSSAPAPPRVRSSVLANEGTLLFLGAGAALPLLEDGGRIGRSRAARTFTSLALTTALTEGLKSATKEERPDRSDRKSFPSGHASITFALATMRAQFRPKQAPYWYAGAALISADRVRLRRHYAHDVIAGALLGHLTARYVLKQWHDPRTPQVSVESSSQSAPLLTVRASF
ncbi:MAG: phosphatase PAP2 family protein [Armatimonadetes bacterium]|nr:phosphatase PAP2 family protein [Armatimonadota bacterium]